MKKRILFVLALLLLLSGCANTQQPQATTVATEATVPQQPGTRLLQVTVTDNLTGQTVSSVAYTYDDAGRVAEENYENQYRVVYTYDDQGRLEKTERYVPLEDAPILTTLHEYSAKGLLIIQQELDAQGMVRATTRYSYGASGKLLKEKREQAEGVRTQYYFYDAEGRCDHIDLYRGKAWIATLQYYYDDQGRISSTTRRSDDGILESCTESHWDGLTETRYYYETGGETFYLTSTITYDVQGNILVQEDIGEGLHNITEYTYEPIEILK